MRFKMRKILIVFFCLIALNAFAENVLFKYTGSENPDLIVPDSVRVITIGDNVYLSGERELIKSLFDNSTLQEVNPPERKLKYTPNDQFFDSQWGLHNSSDTDIDWPESMDIFTNSAETPIIVVMDSGIAWNHPDLESNILTGGDFGNYGFEFCDNKSITNYDDIGHGTHVAGIIGAVTDNTFGVAGVGNNNVKILNMRVICDDSDKINFVAELSAIQKILELKNQGHNIKFVNMSFGGVEYLSDEAEALQQLTDKGIHLFSAAGNSGSSTKEYPAGYSNVIAVGAVDESNNISHYSTYGDWVDIYAPGESIFSTYTEYLAKPESLNLLDEYKDAFRDEFDANNSLTTFSGGWKLDDNGHANIELSSAGTCADNATNAIVMGSFNTDLPDYRFKNIIIRMKASFNSEIFVDWSLNNQDWTNLLPQSGSDNMDYIYRIADIPVASSNLYLRICLEGNQSSTASIDAVRVSASNAPDAFAMESGTSMATPFVTAAASLGYLHKGQFSKNDLITNTESINTSAGELKKLNLYNYLSAEFIADSATGVEDNGSNIETTTDNANDSDGGGGGGGCSIAGSSENNNIVFLLAVLAAFFWVRKLISAKRKN